MNIEIPGGPEEATASLVMLEIVRLAFVDPSALVDDNGRLKPIGELDEDIVAAISGIEIETVNGQNRVIGVTLHDKVAALEMLLRHCEKHDPDSIQRIDDTVKEYLQSEFEKAKRGATH